MLDSNAGAKLEESVRVSFFYDCFRAASERQPVLPAASSFSGVRAAARRVPPVPIVEIKVTARRQITTGLAKRAHKRIPNDFYLYTRDDGSSSLQRGILLSERVSKSTPLSARDLWKCVRPG